MAILTSIGELHELCAILSVGAVLGRNIVAFDQLADI